MPGLADDHISSVNHVSSEGMVAMAWTPRSVVDAKWTRRPANMSLLRVSIPILSVRDSRADTLVVESVPVAHHWANPVAQPKRVTTRGHGASLLMTCPHVCKVTQITSPSPEVPMVVPPVAGPSQVVAGPYLRRV